MEFVCPWLFGKASELELGGSLAKDMILNFIEKTEYVEFVTKFSAVQVFPTDQGFDVDDTALNLSSNFLSPLVLSGCNSLASFRYCFLIAALSAPLVTPRI